MEHKKTNRLENPENLKLIYELQAKELFAQTLFSEDLNKFFFEKILGDQEKPHSDCIISLGQHSQDSKERVLQQIFGALVTGAEDFKELESFIEKVGSTDFGELLLEADKENFLRVCQIFVDKQSFLPYFSEISGSLLAKIARAIIVYQVSESDKQHYDSIEFKIISQDLNWEEIEEISSGRSKTQLILDLANFILEQISSYSNLIFEHFYFNSTENSLKQEILKPQVHEQVRSRKLFTYFNKDYF